MPVQITYNTQGTLSLCKKDQSASRICQYRMQYLGKALLVSKGQGGGGRGSIEV